MTGADIIIAAAGQCVRRSTYTETTPPVSMHKRSEPSTCRVNRANDRRERYRLPKSEQLFLFVAADDELM